MNDLPLELLEAVLMRSFMMLYLINFAVRPSNFKTAGRYGRQRRNLSDFKLRRVEHGPFTLLSSVCWRWHQTLIGWPQSPTPAWLRHQLKKQRECLQWLINQSINQSINLEWDRISIRYSGSGTLLQEWTWTPELTALRDSQWRWLFQLW